MTQISIDEVCPKKGMYPMIINFQNGYVTDRFTEQECIVLENSENKLQTVATVIDKLVYAGEEKSEELTKTFILTRNKKTGKVRLIDSSVVDMKPILKMNSEPTQALLETSNLELSRKFGSKKQKKRMEQREKLKVNVETVTEQMQNVTKTISKDELDLSLYDTQNSDDFYIPPINRAATTAEALYDIDSILTEEQYAKINSELEGKDYKSDLVPLVKSIVEKKKLSPKLLVLAVYASCLVQMYSSVVRIITAKSFVICPHSVTLNELILKNFCTTINGKRNRPMTYKDRAMCHAMVFILLISGLKVDFAELCETFKLSERNATMKIRVTGASVVVSGSKKTAQLKLPLNTKIPFRRKSTKFYTKMEERTHESTCDANFLIKPKEEPLDDLVATDNCGDDTGLIIPKQESNTSLHYDLNEHKVNMVMPIKTELTLSDDMAKLRRHYEASGHGVSNQDVATEYVMIEIKVEQVTNNVDVDSMPVHDDPLLKECTPSQENPAEKKELTSCDVCDKQFKDETDLNLHIKTHTVEKPYRCNLCPKEYTEKSSLTYHLRTHFGEKPFYCEVCDKRFTQKSTLTDHTRTHTGEKPYSCDVCQKKFSKKNNLKQHLRTHTGQKPFSCGICQGKFTEKSSLTTHLRTHTGETPYACDQCPTKFSDRTSLNYHVRTHTGEKPYACTQCPMKYTDRSSLSYHMKSHSGDKPFACEICPMKYKDKRSLGYHIRSHSGRKLFSCAGCEKAYTTKSNLVRHMITHSGT
ncbi:uncharacterized protein LOC123879297 [Maniola jurtina]|uniref:uncharacterized protein LOC123879297 n=1 Tax=Maniola jurtina TaxID=191418 RepID=UPI001E68C2B0|nr:uncharacterized protein LOC123879297 [Maniola jurtina]